MTEHILYSFRRCPYAIRARMALAYAGVTCELRELLLRDKPADMLRHSPKGTVPVLITKSGQVIDESLDVMLWALEQHDPENWLLDATHSTQLIAQIEHEFKPLLDRYKYADRHPEMSEIEHREKTLPQLKALESLLKENDFLIRNSISLADVAIFPFIRQHAFVDKGWFDQQPLPHLQQWLHRFLESSLFSHVMHKFKLYNDGFRYHFPVNDVVKPL